MKLKKNVLDLLRLDRDLLRLLRQLSDDSSPMLVATSTHDKHGELNQTNMNLRLKSEYIKQTVASLGQGVDSPG